MTAPATPHPTFVVPLRDLEDGPQSLASEISVEWLREALDSTEAEPTGQPGHLELMLSKNGAEVLVRGHIRAPVVVPCARTLVPIELELRAEILLLLRRVEPAPHKPRPRQDGVTVLASRQARSQRSGDANRPGDRISKHAKPGQAHRGRGGWPEDPELSTHDAALDTFEGEKIVLDRFVREFIVLELPMFPVRQDLPSLPVDARASAPGSTSEPAAPSEGSDHSVAAAPPIDPRLIPLAELKLKLGQKKKE